MADRIITVTDPSVVTNDTLSGYNNYSDIDGQLGTTMTPAEATNGHTVALSDGATHQVTTKPVGTTNGEFTAVISNAVTVDLASVGYLLIGDTVEGYHTWESADTLPPDTMSFSFKVYNVAGFNTGTHIIARDSPATSNNGFYGVQVRGAGLLRYDVADSVSQRQGNEVSVADGDLIRVDISPTSIALFVNGVSQDSEVLTGFAQASERWSLFDRNHDGASTATATISALEIDGETFDFSEQTGTTATGSEGTVFQNIVAGMWGGPA